ncbi:Pex5p Ecym_1396 [Eremothecium cymbalariae DBVPG|uniref:Uncharacterized protein n=1 Tax=Eremothecium cymbalariae (strain CBS 270.75 / DBVPG 7215 / KCTC 17166 / NRRL Y-17582) TaxID=931890 RepID=G8JM55_ERECY|nr:hypothetical protein Ecym_1396 [Eremothecium cymbalariae DBVPG\
MSADCSVGANPLAQLTKRTQQDRTLQHGTHVNLQHQNDGNTFKSTGSVVSDSNKLHMEQFMGRNTAAENRYISSPLSGPLSLSGAHQQQTFMSSQSTKELVNNNKGITNSGLISSWSQEFHQKTASPDQASPVLSTSSMNSASSGVIGNVAGYRPLNMMRPAMGLHQHIPRMLHTPQSQREETALNREAWDQHFKELEQEVEKTLNISDGDIQESSVPENIVVEEDYQNKFQEIWDDLHDRANDSGLGTEMDQDWEVDYQRYLSGRTTRTSEYKFEQDNQYIHNPNAYEIGCILMENGAKLSEAALAFEAAVQENRQHADAWLRLGLVQTQNEKELSGINALEHCLKVDPNNLTAMMTVAISYINEGYDVSALTMLGKWLETKYPEVVQKRTDEQADRFSLSKVITDQYLKVINTLPEIDPDVQLGLGVLFYANDEFDKTIDCFKAALHVRPNDECMWNRLGASLANSNRSEEAIQAYHRAIQLKPAFVRARYNLAVSSMNIGCYKEAAEQLLTALSMHEVEGVVMSAGSGTVPSSNILETLKRAFMALERRDLLEKVVQNIDLNQFRDEFNF